jgi:peptidoglycan/LPS O-acetylase OafA/YrhL
VLTEILGRKRLPQLDGLRFFACAAVIVYHGGLPVPAGDGVMYFFVLSGFLFAWMFTAYWERKPDSISLRDYYWKRSCRILPAAYGAIAFTLAARHLLKFPISLSHATAAGFYYANYYNALHDHPGWTGFAHYWSLSVEEQFYLMWPICFIFFMRWGGGRTGKLTTFLAVAMVAVCAWRSYAYASLGLGSAYVYNAFDCRFDSLAIGCLAGVLVRRPTIAGLVDKLSAHPASPLITMVGIGLLLRLGETFNYTVGFSLMSLLMALFMLQVICLHRSRWWSWLDNRVLTYLGGALSYSMYLYHGWGLGAARQLAPGSVTLQVILAFPVTIALAAGSYHLVEKPFLWIRDRRVNRKKGLERIVAAAA